jgi:hypothetical protein
MQTSFLIWLSIKYVKGIRPVHSTLFGKNNAGHALLCQAREPLPESKPEKRNHKVFYHNLSTSA